MRRSTFVLLLLIFSAAYAKCQIAGLTDKEVRSLAAYVKDNADAAGLYKGIRQAADRALEQAPDPIETIRSEGLLAGDPLKTATSKSIRDVQKIYSLAVAYRLENDERYLKQAANYLLAWAALNKPTGDPIDETKLDEAIVGYDLIRNKLTDADRGRIDAWLLSVADAELNSKYAKSPRTTAINNWNSHRLKVIAQVAATVHTSRYDDVLASELKTQIAKNLYADGSGFDFHTRDALHYHIYTLEPLLKTLIVLYRQRKDDYFHFRTDSGASVQKSVDFLVPFMAGEKKHIEFANSKVPFDAARAKNGEKGYQPADFKPAEGMAALVQAVYFDPGYRKVAMEPTLLAATPAADRWQLVINTVREPFQKK